MPPTVDRVQVTQLKKTAIPATSVLSRIRPVSEQRTAIKLCAYGRGKTGKTRLACTFPKPMLLIGTEDGTKSVSTVPELDYVRITTSAELLEVVEMVRGSKYLSVSLDTAGGFQDIITKEVLNLAEIPVQRSWGMAQQQDWGVIGMQFKERMSKLLDLADTYGKNVAVIAHERNFKEEGDRGDTMTPLVGAALTPTAASWLNAACDYVTHCYIREQVAVTERKVGGQMVKSDPEPTGKKEFCLRVGPHPIYLTGFRCPPGTELPDAIVDPNFEKIYKLIKGIK